MGNSEKRGGNTHEDLLVTVGKAKEHGLHGVRVNLAARRESLLGGRHVLLLGRDEDILADNHAASKDATQLPDQTRSKRVGITYSDSMRGKRTVAR